MRKATNKDKIKALKAARGLIEDGAEDVICYALVRAAYNKQCGVNVVRELREYIQRSLGCHITLASWVVHNRPKYKGTLKDARLAWIDWMLASLSEDAK